MTDTDPSPAPFDEKQVARAVSRTVGRWIAGVAAIGAVSLVGSALLFWNATTVDAASTAVERRELGAKIMEHGEDIHALEAADAALEHRVTDVAATQRGVTQRLDRQSRQLQLIIDRLPARRGR